MPSYKVRQPYFVEPSDLDHKISDLSGKFRFNWTESSFIFDKDTGKQVAVPGSNTFVGSSISSRTMIAFAIGLVAIFLTLTGRVMYLQIVKGDTYSAMAQNNRQRTLPIPSERGLIFDSNGIQLTKNIPKFSLALVPQDLPRDKEERAAIVARLAELTNQSPDTIKEIIEQYGSYSYESIIIDENLDYDTALSIQIAAKDLPGINIQRGSRRLYLRNVSQYDLFVTTTLDEASTSTVLKIPSIVSNPVEYLSLSHILGYQGKLSPEELDELHEIGYLPSDSIGKTGVEKSYESYLRGTYGHQVIEVDALGKKQGVVSEMAPTPGSHVILTIDATIQEKLEQILQDTLREHGKEKGSVVAVDPRDGSIVALVSLPAFDNNHFSGGIEPERYKRYLEDNRNPLFNRAIAGSFPSGSTIKIAIAAAALQERIITESTSFKSTGGLKIGDFFFPDWLAGGHGIVNVRKSIAQSVNTFYYYIGGGFQNFTGLGIDRINHYLRIFGFATPLGIDIPGETGGFLPTREWKLREKQERWYVGDTYNVSIGQGDVLVTPLQIAMMTSAIANGGTLYTPHVVHAVMDPITLQETSVTFDIKNDDLIDAGYLRIVRLGMKDCVESGSCRQLYGLPVSIGGKTGTAQWRSDRDYHAWFTSFAPFESPEIVLTVLIEEGGEGSEVAVPLAKKFYLWWSQYRLYNSQ